MIVRLLLGFFFEWLFALVSLYVLVFLVVSPFTCDEEPTSEPKTELVYISSNGIHTDIILPIRHPLKNWEETLQLSHFLAVDTFQTHLKFGWGDKQFFLRTKEWSDMEVGTVLKTVFGRGPGAMHLILCTPKDLDKRQLRLIYLTKAQYQRLCSYIQSSFLFVNNHAQEIVNHPYGNYDCFFDSSLEYNMFFTCNTWTNNALHRAGQRTAYWTPFKEPIFSKLK